MTRASVLFTAAITMCAGVTAWTQQASPARTSEVLQQARAYSFQAREGRFDVVPKAVALMEEATAADPKNAALWNALSGAYFLQATAASQAGGKLMDAFAALPRAMEATERALQIDPDDAEALANHGGAVTILSLFQQQPDLGAKGVAEMNRAVALKPSLRQARLVRAFFGVNLPAPLRDTQANIDDLTFLIGVAEGSRAGDMVHLLLGDVYAESGNAADAKRQYEAAARRTSSAAREQSLVRLAALEHGGVPPSDIAALRGSLATNCMMCHAR